MKLFLQKNANFRVLGAPPSDSRPPAAGGKPSGWGLRPRPPKHPPPPPLRISGYAPGEVCGSLISSCCPATLTEKRAKKKKEKQFLTVALT